MPDLAGQSCSNCRFFVGFDEGSPTGVCRRFPPPLKNPKKDRQNVRSLTESSMKYTSMFPTVPREAWCGEFSDVKIGERTVTDDPDTTVDDPDVDPDGTESTVDLRVDPGNLVGGLFGR